VLLLLISVIVGFKGFSSIAWPHFGILFLGGVIGTAAQYCMIRAVKLSKVSELAPCAYLMLIPVTLIDFFMYDKIPDIFITGGLLLIVFGNYLVISKR
jgi:drug/metabolite transporter (DMT)-like permease